MRKALGQEHSVLLSCTIFKIKILQMDSSEASMMFTKYIDRSWEEKNDLPTSDHLCVAEQAMETQNQIGNSCNKKSKIW
jgi:hypothetical protein